MTWLLEDSKYEHPFVLTFFFFCVVSHEWEIFSFWKKLLLKNRYEAYDMDGLMWLGLNHDSLKYDSY